MTIQLSPDTQSAMKRLETQPPTSDQRRKAPAGPAVPADLSQLSDGYHTFAELYEHRYSLMLALMRALPELCWFSQRHADGELPFGSPGWFIVGANLSTGSITYHLPIALLALARKTGAPELMTGHPWDGHTADDVIKRLREWAAAPADGPAVPDSREPASAVGGVSEDLARLAATPAAQAVLDAMRRSYDHEPTRRAIAADVLRALADHQTPAWDGGPLCHWTPTPHTRQELRNIAAELEGSTSTGSTH